MGESSHVGFLAWVLLGGSFWCGFSQVGCPAVGYPGWVIQCELSRVGCVVWVSYPVWVIPGALPGVGYLVWVIPGELPGMNYPGWIT